MEFYNLIFEKVKKNLKNLDKNTNLTNMTNNVIENAQNFIDKNRDKTEFDLIACKSGCSDCCIVFITTLFPEALNIAEYLRKTKKEKSLIPLLEKRVLDTRWTDEEDWSLLGKKCIFLDEKGDCTIYPVRPLLCRAVTSVSVDDCKEAISGKIMGEERAVLMNLLTLKTYRQGFQGMSDALNEYKLDSTGFEITRSVLYALKHTDAEKQFISGNTMRFF